MSLNGLSRSRIFVRLIAIATLCMFAFLWTYGYPEEFVRYRDSEFCRLASVMSNAAACFELGITPLKSLPCFWKVGVISSVSSEIQFLRIEDAKPLARSEYMLLRQLDGCNTTSDCKDNQVPCSYGTEDPSDVMWLRDYQTSAKFVVIFRVGLISLAFFIAALAFDGSIFNPSASGISVFSGSLLILIGISSLLYILLVPQRLQLSLFGAGPLQSLGFVFLVSLIACLLPGIAVIWVNLAACLVFFLGFFLEQVLYILVGVIHFLGVLSFYQAENTLLHLRLIYNRNAMSQSEFDRHLVSISQGFLSRVRHNWYFRRLPLALENDAMQIVSNLLPEHLYDEVANDSIPRIDIENLDVIANDSRVHESEPEDEHTPLLGPNQRRDS